MWSGPVGMPETACDRRAVAVRAIFLKTLYPRLPQGTYVLRIFFAPRGHSEQAAFSPVTITVDATHPL